MSHRAVPAPAARPRRRAPRAAAGVAVALLAVLLAGCSGSSTSGSSAGSAAGAVPAPAAGGATAAGAGRSAASDSTLGAPLAAVTDRAIVVTADVSVRVEDVARATTDLGATVTAHAGTIASQTVSSGSPEPAPYPTNADGSSACPSTGCPTSYASSVTTVRVAPAEVDRLLADVARLGSVESALRTSTDVTADVADVAARVANAQASLARIRALMARATAIGDVVTLEGELSKREADLEALEARQRALADQTAQATVTVRLVGREAPPPASDGTGFLAGLRTGWDAFTGFLAGTLTVVGALVPWLILLVPVAAVWVVLRRRRAARSAVQPTA